MSALNPTRYASALPPRSLLYNALPHRSPIIALYDVVEACTAPLIEPHNGIPLIELTVTNLLTFLRGGLDANSYPF